MLHSYCMCDLCYFPNLHDCICVVSLPSLCTCFQHLLMLCENPFLATVTFPLTAQTQWSVLGLAGDSWRLLNHRHDLICMCSRQQVTEVPCLMTVKSSRAVSMALSRHVLHVLRLSKGLHSLLDHSKLLHVLRLADYSGSLLI